MFYLFLNIVFLGLWSCSAPNPPYSSTNPTYSVVRELQPLPLPHSLGVLPFDYHGEHAGWAWVRQALPDMLITDLSLWPGLDIVSRQLIGEVLREQWIQHRGVTDPRSAVRLGRLSGVRYLLKGSFYVTSSHITVDVHVLDVEDGRVVRAERVSEAPNHLPRLERRLAEKIGGFFGLRSKVVLEGKKKSIQGERITPKRQQNLKVFKEPAQLPSGINVPTSQAMIHSMDPLLRLDRAQRLREEAWKVADEVWRQGFAVELGSPHFGNPESSSGENLKQNVMWVPVTSFFVKDRLRNLHRSVEFTFLSDGNPSRQEGTIIWQSENAMRSRLFIERLLMPRRLFVRAISQTGEVIGTASHGSWRVDDFVTSSEDGSIKLGVWPTLAIVGEVGFSTTLLASHQNLHHYDAVVVTVPGEERLISVEFIDSGRSDDVQTSKFVHQEIQHRLEKWFLKNWSPSIMESLPVHGYLPGNRRTFQLHLLIRSGIVEEAHIVQNPNEELLVAQTESLVSGVVGQCLLNCQQIPREDSDHASVVHVRVQLDLIKDVQSVGLGQTVS